MGGGATTKSFTRERASPSSSSAKKNFAAGKKEREGRRSRIEKIKKISLWHQQKKARMVLREITCRTFAKVELLNFFSSLLFPASLISREMSAGTGGRD